MDSLVQDVGTLRPIIHRTSGQTHGPITRLASPGDLGKVLKPFVFVDLFDNRGARVSRLRTAPPLRYRDLDLHGRGQHQL